MKHDFSLSLFDVDYNISFIQWEQRTAHGGNDSILESYFVTFSMAGCVLLLNFTATQYTVSDG